MALTAFGLTDVGRKRKHNEDAYLLDAERGLFVVADGMGGHVAGEVASRLTVESIQEYIAGTEEDHDNTWPFGYNNRYSVEGNRLSTAVERANEKVMRAVANRPELKGMGTTVVAALFDRSRATLVHVGDSRAYLVRDGELRRLTDDHSWVQEQVNAGILTEEEAKTHPLKNVVTRALGGGSHVAVDLIEIPIGRGDRFLLCSDGLTGMVGDDEITQFLTSEKLPEPIVRGLVELANERGGVDNITAILVEVGGDASTEPLGMKIASAESISGVRTAVSLRPVAVLPAEPEPAAVASPAPAVAPAAGPAALVASAPPAVPAASPASASSPLAAEEAPAALPPEVPPVPDPPKEPVESREPKEPKESKESKESKEP